MVSRSPNRPRKLNQYRFYQSLVYFTCIVKFKLWISIIMLELGFNSLYLVVIGDLNKFNLFFIANIDKGIYIWQKLSNSFLVSSVARAIILKLLKLLIDFLKNL